ncbi:MAG: acetylxylan esterase [Bacteroidetes bacterium]|nr:acetylxylan esterase [Bacteroidota bacterium]
MNAIKCFLLTTYLLIGLFSISIGQTIILRQTNETGIYKKGEKVRVTLLLKDKNTDSVLIKIRKDFSNQLTQKMLKYEGDTLLVFSETFSEPTTYIFQASTKTESASIGLIVAPEEFKPGTSRPKDFDKFWKGEKAALRALPMGMKIIPVKNIASGYQCSDVEINCLGPKPVRGYFAKPVLAKPKSLPIVINFHAAGVSGDWCRSEPYNAMRYAKMGKGALCFDLNAHGMLNGQPDAYYTNLENGELKNYAQQGLESQHDIYFRGMYLRLIRTLDFLTSQPEWDGKRIVVIGESQGGGQSLAAAGLDKRVSAVIVTVPAMCDWGGSLVGRKGSWPYPFETTYDKEKMLSTLPYYDVAHVLKDSRATIVVEIGLIDLTCPSSAVYAAINQAKGKKIILTVPYRAHHMEQPAYKEIWENTISKTKEAFLQDYLK